MANNFQNTSIVKTNTFSKGMFKDTNDMYMSEGLWNHAVNAINNTHYGEVGTIGNEPSNKECASAPYTIIGYAYKSNGQWVLFSTRQGTHGSIPDEPNSDIGIFDEATCTYTSIFNSNANTMCLDFAVVSPITAVCKENYDCTWSVYWQDGHNPDRVINLDKPAYIPNPNSDDDPCTDEGVSATLDCDAIRLHPLVSQPCLKIRKSKGGGQLPNGSYMAVIAYSENGIRLTDYSMPSPAVGLWSHEGIGGSIEVLVNNTDENFNEFELVVIAVVNQQTIAKKIGHYPINIETIHLDQILQSLPTVDLSTIPMKNMVYEKSDKMFEINHHLVRCGVTSQPYFNYQPLANKIKSKWVAVEYPKEYYFSGGTSVGYMRDEVYSFFIRWIYKTGARSASYHIPGRAPNATDRNSVVGDPNRVYTTETERWQVYDTSTESNNLIGQTINDSIEGVEGVIVKSGEMSYWESTEKYPTNPEIWGDLCNKPIRHHKMPSDETIAISRKDNDDKEYIIVLGVKFENILPPVDTDGNIIKDIVGYEILRGSREGNKSIIAKGLFNNMLEYKIPDITQKGLVQNYPYNDVREDPFLAVDATNMTNSNRRPELIQPDSFKKDIFSFHSPETNFIKPYIGNSYIKLYREVSGYAKGKFSIPYKHPQHKLITTGAFALAIPVAVGIGIVAGLGKTTFNAGVEAGLVVATTDAHAIRDAGSATAIPDLIANLGYQGSSGLGVGGVVATLTGIVIMAMNFTYYFGQGMNQVLNIVRNISKWRNYLLQYNSHGLYDKWHEISRAASGAPDDVKRSIRRPSKTVKYIGSHVQDLNSNYRINNINRNKYVCVQVNKAISNVASVKDKSKQRVKNHNNPFEERRTPICSYYGAIKIDYQNQYGQLDSIVQLPTNHCVYPIGDKPTSTDVIFGGDVYINRYTEKNPYMFFNTWMFDQPNGIEFNYRNYVNGPVPAYWVDTNLYDLSDTKISFDVIGSWLSGSHNNDPNTGDPDNPNTYFGEEPIITLPHNFFHLDEPESISDKGWLIKKNSYAYLFYNGVRDFFVESEINLAYRDYGEKSWEKFHDTHYENEFSNLDLMFRSDLITKSIYYKYDMSLSVSKLFSGFGSWGKILPRDYNPSLYTTCFEYLPKRVVYSLKQIEGSKRDNWRNYLPLNFKDFKGKVSVMKSLNATGTVILFEDKEPIFFQGVDQLQSQSGNKFTIGDGGLFANVEQTMVNADDSMGYGECISSRSAVNTPYGLFWISQKSGKIFQYDGKRLNEITRNGMKYWFNENLPSQLLQIYPDYPHYDNPIIGVACQTIYDPQYELLYFIKKDHRPKAHTYTFTKESPLVTIVNENLPTFTSTLYNTQYFEDVSWVVSYDPKSKMWISFHTWIPSLVVPSLKHFYTVDPVSSIPSDLNMSYNYDYNTGKTLWKHNERYDDFCTYYNEPSYWEIDYPIVTNNQITTLRSVEYQLECFSLAQHEYDKAHKLDENFDRALIYNSEQISGWLYLVNKPKNNPYVMMSYPRYVDTPPHYEILYSKEENKYRFNQFWDIVKDRGEFSHDGSRLFITSANGVDRRIVNTAVDYSKPVTQRKKFRHYGNNLLLRRVRRDEKGIMPKMVLKLANNKLLNSPR